MNFSDTPSVPIPREFLAVILAGFGNDLVPLSTDNGDQPCPKALLPIANNPMISFPLRWLEESGIQDVLLICPSSHRPAIKHFIDSDPSLGSQTSLKIDIQTHDQAHDLSVVAGGTCSILRHFTHRINSDFVLLPCDFIPPPSLKLSTVLNKFRIDATTDGALMSSLWYEHLSPEKEKNASEDVWSSLSPTIPIVYDDASGTLLHVDTPDDQDENSDELELRMAMLWKYPQTRLTTRLADSHVYVCRRAVLDLLAQKPQVDSFREEFVPWLCKIHSQRTKREKYGNVLNPITNAPLNPQSLALEHSTTYVSPNVLKPSSLSKRALPDDISQALYPATSATSIATSGTSAGQLLSSSHVHSHTAPHISHRAPSTTDMSSTAPPSPTSSSVRDGISEEASLRCGIVIHRLKDGYAARANTLWTLYELNRQALSSHLVSRESSLTPGLIDPKSSISVDSIVGDSTRLGERSSVKKSVIGRHCVIGKNVRIAGCVVMEHCVIEDGAKLEGCILGKNTKVSAKAELVRSVAQAGFEVEAGGTYKNEKLEVSDWTTAPVDEEDDEGDEVDESTENDD